MPKKKRDNETNKQAMRKAKLLIKAGKLDEAKHILVTVDHPLAKKWIQTLNDKIVTQKNEENSSARLSRFATIFVTISVLAICGFIFALVLFTADEEPAEPAMISTTAPTTTPNADEMATQTEFWSSISELRGIYYVSFADVRPDDDGMLQVHLDIWAVPGHDMAILRSDILEISSIHLGTNSFSAFTVRFDDGVTSNTFTWTGVSWETVTRETIITPTNTPRPLPTQRPQVNTSSGNSSGSSNSSNTSQVPSNCAEAVAMGLTARQAAAYSNLDRDNDGVACYGD